MRKRIIIFDDDKDTLAICSLILGGLNLEVITQENCTNILRILDAHAPQAILIDNHLPGMKGAAGIRLVKESPRHKHIPVIFFTGTNNAQALADEVGADFVLPKPVDLARLEEVIGLAINS
ncbi:MAG: response regulator [Chitinophagaceae bacterium]|nr:response regulator [Chitinophagaceae bacterium]